jgi:putative transposase
MILFGEDSLRKAVHEFVAHYHDERNHQCLANRLISLEAGHLAKAGVVQRRQLLGGMVNYYYRAAA